MGKLINKYSAISSWDGYNYQGHLAILEMLKKIQEYGFENVDKWFLEVEGTEDFSFIHEGVYKSVHQVKKGNFSDGSQKSVKDKFAFIITILENDNARGFYHLSRDRELASDYISKTIEKIEDLEIELNKKVVYIDEDNTSEINAKNILIRAKKSSLKSMIANNLDTEDYNTSDESDKIRKVEDVKKQVKTKLSDHKKELLNKDDADLMQRHEDVYETSKEIREQSQKVLYEICQQEKIDFTLNLAVDDNYYGVLYYKIFDYVMNIVWDTLKIETENQITNGAIINLKEIPQIISKNHIEDISSKGYLQYIFIQGFNEAFEQVVEHECIEESCEICSEFEDCNLVKEVDKFINMQEEQYEYISNISISDLEDLKINEIANANVIVRQVHRLLKEFNDLKFKDNNLALKKGDEDYYISVNTDNYKSQIIEKIEAKINKNSKFISLYFDKSNLVTEHIGKEEVLFAELDITELNPVNVDQLSDINIDVESSEDYFFKETPLRILKNNQFKEEIINE